MGGRAATARVPSYEADGRCAAALAKELRMIGVALADWLLDQQPHDRLGDALGREAKQSEELSCRRGLSEAIDSDDGPCTPDVLVPEVRRPRLDSNAR